jgi:hypothetical protein
VLWVWKVFFLSPPTPCFWDICLTFQSCCEARDWGTCDLSIYLSIIPLSSRHIHGAQQNM